MDVFELWTLFVHESSWNVSWRVRDESSQLSTSWHISGKSNSNFSWSERAFKCVHWQQLKWDGEVKMMVEEWVIKQFNCQFNSSTNCVKISVNYAGSVSETVLKHKKDTDILNELNLLKVWLKFPCKASLFMKHYSETRQCIVLYRATDFRNKTLREWCLLLPLLLKVKLWLTNVQK